MAAASRIIWRRNFPISPRPFFLWRAPAEDVAKIKAALLIHYAGNDDASTRLAAYEAALKAAGVNTRLHLHRRASWLQQ